MSNLISALFETKAFRPCEENKPFWYTSGKIGPYYINTHFLYGSEEKAVALLALIDEALTQRESCSEWVATAVMENYHHDPIFKDAIDGLVSYIQTHIGKDEFEVISGGERRDWFFSLPAAILMDIPHVTLFKDGSMQSYYQGKTTETAIQGKKVLHIADLITEASSYERAWVPAIQKAEGKMINSVVMVDRKQGGSELLTTLGVKSHALVSVDPHLFDTAKELGLLNDQQHQMLSAFFTNPTKAMEDFLKAHPSFLADALKADAKTAARAQLCIDSKFYQLD